MKYRVLIADDEEMIRRLIEVLIPWDELNLELAATVSNGLEAMEYLEKNDADILITDARMPGCDGIELIRWCSEQKRNMKYIVISGYRHFEYAHGALQYGADSYLLKPINQQELTASLKSIVEKLGDDSSIAKQDQSQQNEITRNRMRRHFVSSYIFDGRDFPDRDIPSVEYINEEFQVSFSNGIYRAIYIRADMPAGSGISLASTLERMLDDALGIFGDILKECVGCVIRSGIMLFVNYGKEDEVLLKNELEKLYDRWVKMLDIFEDVSLVIGLSHREDSINGIHRCLESASDALKYQLYLPHVSIIDYDNYNYREVPANTFWTAERSRLLENHMHTGNAKDIQKLLFDLKLEIHQDKDLSPVSIYAIVKTAAENAVEYFNAALKANADKYTPMEDFTLQLDNIKTVDGIVRCLENMILHCIEIMETESKQQEIQPIRIIRDYIEEHYAENISLNDVADQVQLSRNYVSAIFRRETGVNYLDFLTSMRIDKAAELLRNTNMSISEIAETVGYTDVKYFSKMCKKKLGMNPSEYRKLYS